MESRTHVALGIQFHLEVTHGLKSREVISRFTVDIYGCRTNWTIARAHWKRDRTDQSYTYKGSCHCAVSGEMAIGDRLHIIMVVLRLNEAKQVEHMLNEILSVNLTVVDTSELFLS